MEKYYQTLFQTQHVSKQVESVVCDGYQGDFVVSFTTRVLSRISIKRNDEDKIGNLNSPQDKTRQVKAGQDT